MAQTIMLAAGGTGGHLFPAQALAEELGRRGFRVELMSDARVAQFGRDFPAAAIHRIAAAPLRLDKPLAAMRSGLVILRGIAAANRILAKARPAAVIGFGGYPTFPPLVAARLRGLPRAVHEANAVLGRVNRLLQRQVSAIATSFAETRHLAPALGDRVRLTGNPVRAGVLAAAGRAYAPPRAGEPVTLTIFGGSQGARFLSDIVPAALTRLSESLAGRLIVHQQAREEDVARVRAAYELAGIKAHVASFFADLPMRISQSHLVIARSGASTIAELTVLGRPAILVPLPHALDNDQLENAIRLAERGAAWLIEQAELGPERLEREIARLLEDGARLEAAAQNAKALGRPDAAGRLADLAEALMNQRG